MKKKFLALLIVAAFLIVSLGVISAADDSDSISVKIVWDDSVDVKPDYVTVDLLKDGEIVDTAKLDEDNFWETEFDIDGNGNYEIKENISSDYSNEIKGSVQDGFVITNKLVKEDVLGASEDQTSSDEDSDDVLSASDNQTPLEENSDEDDVLTANATENSQLGANSTNDTDNSTDDNSTEDSTTGSDDDSGDDSAEDSDDGSDDETTTVTTTTTTKTTKKVDKEDEKKPENNTTELKNTGFPLIVLVVAVFIAIFIPFSRKK